MTLLPIPLNSFEIIARLAVVDSCLLELQPSAMLQVVEGLDIVRQIEQSNTDRADRPKSAVVISDAGEL